MVSGGIHPEYTGEYWSDYIVVKGEDDEDRSSWCDKYTSVIFRSKGNDWHGTPQQ